MWEIISELLVLHTKKRLGIALRMTIAYSWPQGSLTPLFDSVQSLDLAEYNVLFILSFATPAFDSDVAPCFGTLLATVNVALNTLGEVLDISLSGRAPAVAVISERLFS